MWVHQMQRRVQESDLEPWVETRRRNRKSKYKPRRADKQSYGRTPPDYNLKPSSRRLGKAVHRNNGLEILRPSL